MSALFLPRGIRGLCVIITTVVLMSTSVRAQVEPATNLLISKSKSRVTYVLQHPLHIIRGVSKDVTGTVNLMPDTLGSEISISIPVSSFDTGNESRDSHALEVVEGFKYPMVRFNGIAIRPETQGKISGWLIEGEVEFHGVKKQISFIAHPSLLEGQAHVTGSFGISLEAHQVERPKLLFFPVKDSLRIELDLVSENEIK